MLYSPFKNLQTSVRSSVSASFQPIFLKLGIRVDIGKECLEIADG